MKKYSITIKFDIVYDDEPFQDKTSLELAQDIAELVCDEVVTAGGVCGYDIMECEKEDT